MTSCTTFQTPWAHGRPFVRNLAGQPLESPPFLNFSSANHFGWAPSSATPHRVSHTQHPHVPLEPHLFDVSHSYAATGSSGFHTFYTATLPSNSVISNGHATPASKPFTTASTASTARGSNSTATRAVDVPWTTVIWFPPASSRMVAAIVAATVVPVALTLIGGIFLLRFFRRQEIAGLSGQPTASLQQSAISRGHWVSNAGRGRLSHGVPAQSRGLSVRVPLAAAASAAREQEIHSAGSISLRNVPQGVYERHFGDLSFLLDESEPSEGGDDLGGDGHGVIEVGTGWDHNHIATGELVVQDACYQIPFSVLGLEKAGQEFTDLNERFGLQV